MLIAKLNYYSNIMSLRILFLFLTYSVVVWSRTLISTIYPLSNSTTTWPLKISNINGNNILAIFYSAEYSCISPSISIIFQETNFGYFTVFANDSTIIAKCHSSECSPFVLSECVTDYALRTDITVGAFYEFEIAIDTSTDAHSPCLTAFEAFLTLECMPKYVISKQTNDCCFLRTQKLIFFCK